MKVILDYIGLFTVQNFQRSIVESGGSGTDGKNRNAADGPDETKDDIIGDMTQKNHNFVVGIEEVAHEKSSVYL